MTTLRDVAKSLADGADLELGEMVQEWSTFMAWAKEEMVKKYSVETCEEFDDASLFDADEALYNEMTDFYNTLTIAVEKAWLHELLFQMEGGNEANS